MDVSDHSGRRNSQTLPVRQIHKNGSGIYDRKTFRCAERALDQCTRRRFRAPVTLFTGVETVQVLRSKVIAGNNEIGLRGRDGSSK
jgi:hypothetical protein